MARILITGARGMLGSSLMNAATQSGRPDEYLAVTRDDVDLRDFTAVSALIEELQPDTVIHTAARVGGIAANIASPTEFIVDNLLLDTAVIESSRRAGVSNLVYFGSSCMYPKDYGKPLSEDDVLAAPLEPTNEGYALSKIAAAKTCGYISSQYGLNYKVLIPSNLYGPGDDYTSGRSHLVASTILKAHEAKLKNSTVIEVWGDGKARREFTYIGDVANWVVSNIDSIATWPPMMNIGLGTDHSVADFYNTAAEVVGIDPVFQYDVSRPVGMRQKLMDSSLAHDFGWNPSTDIRTGMQLAYQAFLTRDQQKDA